MAQRISSKEKQAYMARCEEIASKYAEILRPFHRFQKNLDGKQQHHSIFFTQEGHRAGGLSTGIDIIKHQRGFAPAREILEQQLAEPSVPPEFKNGVRLVLEDLNATEVGPVDVTFLRIA